MHTKKNSHTLASLLQGTHVGPAVEYTRLWHDSRTIEPADAYVAIKGARVDGHTFAANAQAKGATLIVAEKMVDAPTQIIVPNVLDALYALGHTLCKRTKNIALTGSCGKTSTKMMLASIFADTAFYTPGNLNSEFGVPIALSVEPQTPFAIIECGMGKIGDISYLANMIEPYLSVITNISETHIEFTGSLENTAREKGQLLTKSTIGVVPANSPYMSMWQNMGAKLYTFGPGGDCAQVEDKAVFTVCCLGETFSIEWRVLGAHMRANALAAILAARLMGVCIADIQKGLSQFTDQRLTFFKHASGALILDDTYNAPPEGVRAAIDVLALHTGNRVLVVSSIPELGDQTERVHTQIGMHAKQQGVQTIYAIGPQAEHIVQAHGTGQVYHTKEALIAALQSELLPHSVILIKGANKYALGDITKALGG